MKYLSTQHFSTITIEDRATIRFVVPVQLAMVILWFLANRPARLAVLVAWPAGRLLLSWYRLLFDLKGWRNDLIIIRLAILDLLGYKLAYTFA